MSFARLARWRKRRVALQHRHAVRLSVLLLLMLLLVVRLVATYPILPTAILRCVRVRRSWSSRDDVRRWPPPTYLVLRRCSVRVHPTVGRCAMWHRTCIRTLRRRSAISVLPLLLRTGIPEGSPRRLARRPKGRGLHRALHPKSLVGADGDTGGLLHGRPLLRVLRHRTIRRLWQGGVRRRNCRHCAASGR